MNPRKSHITLRQLGSHTSGLADAEDQSLPHDKLTGWQGDFWKRLNPPLAEVYKLASNAANRRLCNI